jgi:hypothetical protein
MSFDFNPTDAWAEPSLERILGEGNHICDVVSLEDGTSSGGHPQIAAQFRNQDGEIRDWLVITPNTFGKITSFILALGVEQANYPKPDDDFDSSTGRFKQEYLDALVKMHRKVGLVVRNEDDPRNIDPSTMQPRKRARVKGYVHPDRITERQSDVTGPTDSAQFAGVSFDQAVPAASGPGNANDVLPF